MTSRGPARSAGAPARRQRFCVAAAPQRRRCAPGGPTRQDPVPIAMPTTPSGSWFSGRVVEVETEPPQQRRESGRDHQVELGDPGARNSGSHIRSGLFDPCLRRGRRSAAPPRPARHDNTAENWRDPGRRQRPGHAYPSCRPNRTIERARRSGTGSIGSGRRRRHRSTAFNSPLAAGQRNQQGRESDAVQETARSNFPGSAQTRCDASIAHGMKI